MLTDPLLLRNQGIRRPPGWVLVLCVLLIVWKPLGLALRIAALLPTLGYRGPLATLIIVWRVVLMGIGIAAGIALWRAEATGVTLAKVFLFLSAATAILAFETSTALISLPPFERRVMLTGVLIYNSAWYAYLARSRRVKEAYAILDA